MQYCLLFKRVKGLFITNNMLLLDIRHIRHILDYYLTPMLLSKSVFDSSLLKPKSYDAFRTGINHVPFNCGLIQFN